MSYYKKHFIIISILLVVIVSLLILPVFLKKKSVDVTTKREIADKESKVNEFLTKRKSFEQWKKINDDVAMILEINNQQLPVVEAKGEEYLHKNIYKEYDFYGNPYIPEENDIDNDDNIIVYGHSSSKKDLVFSFVKNYEDLNSSFWKQNAHILMKENTARSYKPLTLIKIDQNEFENKTFWNTFMITDKKQLINNLNKYGNKKVEKIDKLLMLVTCNLNEPGNEELRYVMIYNINYDF